MRCIAFLAASVSVVALAFMLSGCGSLTSSSDSSDQPTNGVESGEKTHHDDGSHHENGHHQHDNGHHADAGQIEVNLAKLSDTERTSAEKQRICPVSDDPLGSMGPPKKVSVDGETVWICCEGCREPLESEPAKYLAKLKK